MHFDDRNLAAEGLQRIKKSYTVMRICTGIKNNTVKVTLNDHITDTLDKFPLNTTLKKNKLQQ